MQRARGKSSERRGTQRVCTARAASVRSAIVPKANRPSLTYRDAGVDIDRGNALVDRIRTLASATARPEQLSGIGGFGALFEVPVERYRRPVLVSGADGVGTKLKLAIETGRHDTVGIDLVAMCVNDVLVHGAEPLFFLDYFATGRPDAEVGEQVVAGIAEGCRRAGAALIGGETAEMPGMYADGDYDLAGFCVGVVERERMLDGAAARAGEAVVGLASSGFHSNGYSLVRRAIAGRGVSRAIATISSMCLRMRRPVDTICAMFPAASSKPSSSASWCSISP